MNQTQLDRIEAKLDILLERTAPKKAKSRKKHTGDDIFDRFWDAYPLKKGKQAALRAFNNLPPTIAVQTLIDDVLNRTENEKQWLAGYIPHAATYLNGERWNDCVTLVEAKQAALPQSNDDLMAWASNHGHRQPNPGETFPEYRFYLQGKLQ